MNSDVEQDLAAVREYLREPVEIDDKDLLNHVLGGAKPPISPQPEQPAETPAETPRVYVESKAGIDALLKTLNIYRARLGVSDEISNARLVQLIAENQFIPDQPTRDNRSISELVRDWLMGNVDSRFLAWQDSKAGRMITAIVLIAICGFAVYPGLSERRQAYKDGYNACAIRAQIGEGCNYEP